MKAKLTVCAFCWNMGAVNTNPFVLRFHNFHCRVDSTVGTDEKEETPFDIAWRILFYSTEDTERNYTEIAELLSEGSEELSDKMKLRRLLKAMYTDDKFEGMEEFSEILSSLSPELVSF